MAVQDDLRELRESLRQTDNELSELGERMARLEMASRYAHEDRVAMRGRVETIASDLAKLQKSIDAIMNQAKGASLLARGLWTLGGVIGALAAHFSGLLHHILPFIPPPR